MIKKCVVCSAPLAFYHKINTRRARYCSLACKNKAYRPRQREWERNQSGIYEKGKIPCQLCGGHKWYHKLALHTYQAHGGITGREYREALGLDVKKGLLSPQSREIAQKQIADNPKGLRNLAKGKKYRYRKGDPSLGKFKRSKQTVERLKAQLKQLHARRKKQSLLVGRERRK